MKIVYIALGSNLGDRAENLRLARERIDAPDLRVLRASSIYETAPRDVEDQPWFLNQVIECETDLFPRQLLARLQKIERAMGRKRRMAKGPREIDLDILLFGDAVVKAPELEIPHPRIDGAALCAGAAGGTGAGEEASRDSADDAGDAGRSGESSSEENLAERVTRALSAAVIFSAA